MKNDAKDKKNIRSSDLFFLEITAVLVLTFSTIIFADGVPFGGYGAGHWTINQTTGAVEMMEFSRMGSAAGVTGNAAPAGCYFAAYVKSGTTVWAHKLLTTDGVSLAYNGKYPKLFIDYTSTTLPIKLSTETVTPFIVNNDRYSSAPMVLYIFKFQNTSQTAVDVAGAVAWQVSGASAAEVGTPVRGFTLTASTQNHTVMAASAPGATVTCGSNYAEFTSNGAFTTAPTGAAALLSGKVLSLAPGQSVEIAFAITWYYSNPANGIPNYQKNWASSLAVADTGRTNYATIRAGVDKWYNRIMNSSLPAWVKDHVTNGAYVASLNSAWRRDGIAWLVEAAVYDVWGTYDHQSYSSIFDLMFAPGAADAWMGGFANNQQTTGAINHGLSSFYETCNWIDIQSMFICNVARNYFWRNDSARIRDYYWPKVKNVVLFCINSDNNSNYLPDNPQNSYDNTTWINESSYNCSWWLAALKAVVKMAQLLGDNAYATQMQTRLTSTQTAFETLWNQSQGHYNVWPGNTGSMDGQVAGQWYADFLGLGDVVNTPAHIGSSLNYIHTHNIGTLPNASCGTMRVIKVSDNGAVENGECWYPVCYHYSFGAIRRNLTDTGLIDTKLMYDVFNVTHPTWKYHQTLQLNDGGNGCPGWGDYYITTPMLYHLIADLTGYSLNLPAKELTIKPYLATGTYNMNNQINAPLIGSLCWGDLSFTEKQTAYDQYMKISFDRPLTFDKLFVKNTGVATVYAQKGGSAIPATIAASGTDYLITFSPAVTIDSNGIEVWVNRKVSTLPLSPGCALKRTLKFVCRGVSMSVDLPSNVSADNLTVKVLDLKGRTVADLTGKLHAGTIRWEPGERSAGVYLFTVKTAEATVCRPFLVN